VKVSVEVPVYANHALIEVAVGERSESTPRQVNGILALTSGASVPDGTIDLISVVGSYRQMLPTMLSIRIHSVSLDKEWVLDEDDRQYTHT
jgi:hypothetical protein